MQISLGFTFGITEEFTLNGRIDTKLLGSYNSGTPGAKDTEFGPQLNIHLWPTYDLGFAAMGLDFGFICWKEDEGDANVIIARTDGIRVGVGLYLEKTIGVSTIRGGLAYCAPTKVGERTNALSGKVEDDKSNGMFSIPIALNLKF
jgi:hypothetical protein